MRIASFFNLIILFFIFGCQQVKSPSQNIEIENNVLQIQEKFPDINDNSVLPVTNGQDYDNAESVITGEEVLILGRGGFNPDQVIIKKGSTVLWIVDDKSVHILSTIDSGMLISRRLNPGDKFQFTFDNPGSFEIIDSIFKKSMKVIVE